MDKKRIHEMLEKLTEITKAELDSKGCAVDTAEMGAVVDMIKDLASAEKDAWEKCYYEKIVEAMKEEEEFEEQLLKHMIAEHGETEGRMGYDRWRTSHGRFARKGHGHETSMAEATGRAGFMPDWPYVHYDDPRYWEHEPWIGLVGYGDGRVWPDGRRTDQGTRTSDGQHVHATGRMGYPMDHEGRPMQSTGSARDGRQYYDNARRHFHESGTQESRMMMDEKAKEYVGEAMDTMKDIFMEADPELQKKMKDDLFRLCRDLGITDPKR